MRRIKGPDPLHKIPQHKYRATCWWSRNMEIGTGILVSLARSLIVDMEVAGELACKSQLQMVLGAGGHVLVSVHTSIILSYLGEKGA